jgi:hypothetical protein
MGTVFERIDELLERCDFQQPAVAAALRRAARSHAG